MWFTGNFSLTLSIYSYTGHNRSEQANRRPDAIQQIIYEDEEQDRT